MPLHLTETGLDDARLRADPPADTYLAAQLAGEASRPAFYAALKQGRERLWGYVKETGQSLTAAILPWPAGAKPWWRAEAQRLFARRGNEIMLLLGLYSLPYCYAAAKGAKVLAATGRLAPGGNAHVRLQETAGFVRTVLTGSGQEARQACLHTRLIHALVRHHLLAQGWDAAADGLPVNQEDMAGTNLAFGFLTVRGLRALNLALSPAEAEAYLGWFAVLGQWLGVEPNLAPAAQAEAYALGQAIERRHHAPSQEGRLLTQTLIASLAGAPGPGWLKDRAPELMASLLGPPIAPLLGLPATDDALLHTLRRLNAVRV